MIYTESIFEKKDVELYRIYELEKTNLVSAFYTTNHISAWKYGNSPWKSSYELLSKQLGVTMTDMCTTYQTHTDNIRVMKKENGGEGIIIPTNIQDYDGIITNETNLLLCSFEADCVPVYFLDPVKKAIGLSHSGWKGTCKEIAGKTIDAMAAQYSTKPEDLIVVIGPCACENCYEVGQDLIDQFSVHFKDNIKEIFVQKNSEKYYLDLKKAIEITLLKADVKSSNIFSVNRCTIESDYLCSFRRTKSTTDHMLTAIMLNK